MAGAFGRPRLGDDRPRSTAAILGHPLRPMLAPFPTVCFSGALLTDLAYVRSANVMWTDFSVWLITAGLVMGGLAVLAGIIDYVGDRRVRAAPPATPYLIVCIVVLVLELFNAFVHSRDGWTSVWPTGLTLSIVSVVLLLIGGWLGGSLVYRYGVGTPR